MKRIVYRGEVYNRIEAARIKALKNFASSHYMDGYHDGLKEALQILANEVTDVSPQVYVDSLEQEVSALKKEKEKFFLNTYEVLAVLDEAEKSHAKTMMGKNHV